MGFKYGVWAKKSEFTFAEDLLPLQGDGYDDSSGEIVVGNVATRNEPSREDSMKLYVFPGHGYFIHPVPDNNGWTKSPLFSVSGVKLSETIFNGVYLGQVSVALPRIQISTNLQPDTLDGGIIGSGVARIFGRLDLVKTKFVSLPKPLKFLTDLLAVRRHDRPILVDCYLLDSNNQQLAEFTSTMSQLNSLQLLRSEVQGAKWIEFRAEGCLKRRVLISDVTEQFTFTLVPGDVDGSNEIDSADVDSVVWNFGISEASPEWVRRDFGVWGAISDVDLSGEVDSADIDRVIENFGQVGD